jgi:hypothetical protein
MRPRTTVAAAAGALLLGLSVPSSAFAADGRFEYSFGPGFHAGLDDPGSGECIELPEAAAEDPAYAPANRTDSTATVFLDAGCEGDTYYVVTPGQKFGDRLKLRSVIFS